MRSSLLPAFTLSSLLALPSLLSGQCETAILTAPDSVRGGQLGAAVAITGRWAVVGAPGDGLSDAVYVYQRQGSDWVFFQKLTAPDGRRHDDFGHAVAISNGALAIGAPRHGTVDPHSGAAYVYRFDGQSWVLEDKLVPSDTAASDHFGYAVAMAGEKVFVGAHLDDDRGRNSGSVYLFRHDGGWVETDKLTAPDGLAGDEFGSALAADQDRLLVGARGWEAHGAAYFWQFDGAWSCQDPVFAWDRLPGSRFGFSVGLHGDLAVIGAPGHGSTSIPNRGRAHVYRHDGQSWSHDTAVVAPDGSAGDMFGHAVGVRGDHIAVTAVHDDDSGNNSGSAYLFRDTGPGWPLQRKVLASDGSPDSQFGDGVALYGKCLLVGARFHDAARRDGGAAYTFMLARTIADWQHYGSGWAGTFGIPTMTPAARPAMGTTLQVTVENSLRAPTRAILLIGFDDATRPTSLGGAILVDIVTVLSIDFRTSGDQVLSFQVPCGPAWDGQSAFLQVLTWDPGATKNVSFTPGLELIVGS